MDWHSDPPVGGEESFTGDEEMLRSLPVRRLGMTA
jgi:hypothetical protein